MNETAKRKIICVSGRDKDKIIEASSMLLGYCMGCGFATGLLAPDEYILDDRQDDPDEAPDEALDDDWKDDPDEAPDEVLDDDRKDDLDEALDDDLNDDLNEDWEEDWDEDWDEDWEEDWDEDLGEDYFEETATDPTVWKKILKTAEETSPYYEVLIFAGCFSSAAISRLRKAIPDMMHLAIVSEEPQEILPWQLGILDPQQDMDLCDGIIRASGDSKELWNHVSLFGEYVIAECNLDSFIHSIY